jgi:hypothetical protein
MRHFSIEPIGDMAIKRTHAIGTGSFEAVSETDQNANKLWMVTARMEGVQTWV